MLRRLAYARPEMDDPELHLLIATCRAAFAGNPPQSIKRIDWLRLLLLARRHRVEALCWRGLHDLRRAVPPDVAAQLSEGSSAIIEANLRAAAESARLLALFERAGTPLLFVKGLTLGALAYPSPFLKMSWDIDILIDPDALLRAVHLLRSAGYLPAIPASASDDQLRRWHRARKESVWHHAERRVHLDLHTRLAEQAALLPDVDVRSPSQTVQVASGIDLPTLGKDELFAYLSVHGASSAWFRLKWIADFAALLRDEPAEEIERLYARSLELGAGRAAAQAVLLASQLFGIELGSNLAEKLLADPVNRRLVGIARQQLANRREPTERPFGTAWIHLSQLLLMPGWRFKLSELTRQVGDFASRKLR